MKQFFTNKEDNTSVKQSIEGKSKSSACSDSDIPEIESPAVSSIKSKKCKEVPNNNNKTVPSPPTHGPSKRAHAQILNFSDSDIPGIDSPMVSPVKSKKCKEVPMFNNKTVPSPPTHGPSKRAHVQILNFSDSDIPGIDSPMVSPVKSKKCKEVPMFNNKTVPSPPTHGPSKRAHVQILNFSDSDIPGIDSPAVSPIKLKKSKEVPTFNSKIGSSPPTRGPSKRAHVQILNFSDSDIPGIDSPMVSPVKSKKCKEVPMFNNKTVPSPPAHGPSKRAHVQILNFSDSDIPGIDSPMVSPVKSKKYKEVPTFNSKIGSSPPTRGPSKRAQAQILNFSDSDIPGIDSPAISPVKSKKSEVPTFNNRQVPSPRTSSPLKIGYKSVDFRGPVSAVSPIMKTKSQIDLNRKPFLPSKSASRKADIIYISSPSVKLTTQPTVQEIIKLT